MTTEREDAHPSHTVLVVDDSVDSRDALGLLLELEGFRVEKAGSAHDALRMIEAEGLRPCLIVLDLLLPEMGGLAFRQRLLANPDLAGIPVVALTGHEGQRRQAEGEGAFTAALLKPADIDSVLALVGNHCPRAGATCTAESDTPPRRRA